MFEQVPLQFVACFALCAFGALYSYKIVLDIFDRRKVIRMEKDNVDNPVTRSEFSTVCNDILNRVARHEQRSEQRMDKVDSDLTALKLVVMGQENKFREALDKKLEPIQKDINEIKISVVTLAASVKGNGHGNHTG